MSNSVENITDDSVQEEMIRSTNPFFAVVFYLAALVLAVYGLFIAFQDSSYSNKVVGGDAYNYIIFAGRATVVVGAGIISAILGLGCQIAVHVSNFGLKSSISDK